VSAARKSAPTGPRLRGVQPCTRRVGGPLERNLTDFRLNFMASKTSPAQGGVNIRPKFANSHSRTADLSKKITVDVSGEILETQGYRLNTIGDPASNRVRVGGFHARGRARLDTEGKLGRTTRAGGPGRRYMEGSHGQLNFMARLTYGGRWRNIAEVTTAVARGDLFRADHP